MRLFLVADHLVTNRPNQFVTGAEFDRELVAIDEALKTIAEMDPRKARVIELSFFGGLSVEETAEVLKFSPSVLRDWKLAKGWLMRELTRH
jgi:DNA-directed RNA polymerase specialized sigma24 family protein